MSNIRVFVDFGSTFTKAVAFDIEKLELLGRVQVPSTVETDVTEGLKAALHELGKLAPVGEEEIKNTIACSSAAGGLRLAVIGLVPDYTTKAGHLAALGAGAKVVGQFSFEMSRSETRRLNDLAPDIVLLTGGTDGGNKKTIIHNANVLANSAVSNIIVAGNKSARDDIEDAFDGTGKNVYYADNVMPEFGRLELDSVNERVREVFLARIMDAKGISRAAGIIGRIAMPTPAAVMEAVHLIADGTRHTPGLGELLVVDVGGATTDVYSAASGVSEGLKLIGIKEPYMKRSVEGDLGLFHNLDTLAELAEENTGLEELLKRRSVPSGDESVMLHERLTKMAVNTAVSRHVGRLESIMTGDGPVWVQRGKDLRKVKLVIGAGGPVVFARNHLGVLMGATGDGKDGVLMPKEPKFALDHRYILFAVGLLSLEEPEKALSIAKKYIMHI
ncbi:MAG: methylaspartate mutase accessory protein GlmL [Oscillospiraceae bacterium]|nr:methylaspartate mutase accessory protein GlmL [Oscillospiraceae bacterium]